jgi:DNA-binding transcriptional ArsR family regulator
MSSLLIHEPPLQVLPSLAKIIGLNEAILLQQTHYWLLRAEHIAEDTDGIERRWVHKTLKEWERELPFWSQSTIRRTLRSLKDADLLVAERLRKRDGDQTVFYSINYESLTDAVARARSCSDPSSPRPRAELFNLNTPPVQSEHLRAAHNARARSETTTESVSSSCESAYAPARTRAELSTWIPDGHQHLLPEIESVLDELENDRTDLLQIGRRYLMDTRRGTLATSVVASHASNHADAEVAAAYVIAGITASGNPMKYASSMLDNRYYDPSDTQTHDSTDQQSVQRGSEEPRGGQRDGDEHDLWTRDDSRDNGSDEPSDREDRDAA